MNTSKCFYRIGYIIIMVCLPICIFLSIMESYAFNEKFYMKSFVKYDVMSTTKMEMKDLGKVTNYLMEYLKNNREDLSIDIEINAKNQEVFGKRERKHLVDVKNLFKKGYIIKKTSFIGCIFAIMVLVKKSKKNFYKGLLHGSIVGIGSIVLIFICIQYDFYRYFTYFHKLLFTNDLWMLDPNKDVLIQMFPLEFFEEIATKIIIIFLGSMFLIGAYSTYKMRGWDFMKNPIVTIEMENGKEIKIELYPEVAPNTVNNFIGLVKKGYYDDLIFHRVISGFMLQGGCPQGSGTGGPGYGIKGEFAINGFKNDLKHARGVISMARSSHPDSAGSQFFIMHENSPHLDGQYAGFGKVIEGIEEVDSIAAVKTNFQDRPSKDQKMKKVTVELFGEEYSDPETV